MSAASTFDADRWRRAWEAADLPAAIFDAAEALTWALGRERDPVAWALTLVSLLDRREGSTWTPLEREHFDRRLSAVELGEDRPAIVDALGSATVDGLWAPPGGDPRPPTPWVRVGDAVAPRRSWRDETRIAGWLQAARAAPEAAEDGPPTSSEASGLAPDQEAAVRAGLQRRLVAITGGPGTGKTTVIAALVRRLLAAGTAPEAIALAAPTGKAAQRLRESLARAGVDAPLEVETLHRRLGYRPIDDTFTAGRDRPLAADVVIVDEASMIDLRLMERLVAALDPGARLVLVGDADQLPSVDAGAVFRDLVDAAPEQVWRLASNRRVAPSAGGQALVELASEIRDGRARLPAPEDALPSPDAEGVFTLRRSGDPRLDRRLWHAWVDGPDPDRAKILTVVRDGPHGSAAANLETAARRSARAGTAGWAPGQPVMVTRNLYARGLFNGDLGVVVEGGGPGRRAARFAAADAPEDEGRSWDLEALGGDLVGADALTVHKAQGSEFDRVMIWLPPEPHPLLSRELLYTAVTRARRQVVIAGDLEVFQSGVRRPIRRRTGGLAS